MSTNQRFRIVCTNSSCSDENAGKSFEKFASPLKGTAYVIYEMAHG